MKKQLLSSSCLTNESGRSMVEMLGVLAIIGVLSVAGVAGYGRAITAHRANTAVETAQREAAIVAGEIATGQKVEPSSAPILKASSGYEVAVRDVTGGTTDIVTTTPFFGVEIGGGNGQAVQRNVAKSIVERAEDDWKHVHGVGVISGEEANRTIKWLTSSGTGTNGFESEVSEDAQTVTIIVVYATDLSPRKGDLLTDFSLVPEGDTPTTCPTGTDTSYTGGHAVTLQDGSRCYCETGSVWNSDSKTCDTKPNICTSYRDCNKGEFCYEDYDENWDRVRVCVEANTTELTINGNTYYRDYDHNGEFDMSIDYCNSIGHTLVTGLEECTEEEKQVILNNLSEGRAEHSIGTCAAWNTVDNYFHTTTIDRYNSDTHMYWDGGSFWDSGDGVGYGALCK